MSDLSRKIKGEIRTIHWPAQQLRNNLQGQKTEKAAKLVTIVVTIVIYQAANLI